MDSKEKELKARPSLFQKQEPNPSKELNVTTNYGRGLDVRKHFCDRLYRLQTEDTLCDITIIVGGKTFRAHRVILAAASDYFESMLTSGFKERDQSEISIDGDGYAFSKLLQFAYSGELCLSQEIVIEVLKLACYMQFTKVITMCSRFLVGLFDKDLVTYEDAFLIVMLARPHGKALEPLQRHASQELSVDFEKFLKNGTFLREASDTFLEEFLRKDFLARNSKEEEV